MPALKVLHTADLHINALKSWDGYLSRMESTLGAIHDIAKKQACDLIIVAGDVWDTLSITHNERQLFSDWLGSSRHPTIVISGNHDKRDSEETSLGYLSSLNSIMQRHLVWDGIPTVKLFHDCVFILFPGFGWSDAEFDLMLQAMIPTATKLAKNRYPIICVAHEYVVESKTDGNYIIPAKSTHVRIRSSKYPEVTYWALGDVHVTQRVAPNAYYSGSPHQTSFKADPAKTKGVLVTRLSKPDSPKFINIDSLPLLILEDLPEHVPENAFIYYKPTKLEARVDLPKNVVYHPAASMYAKFKSDGALRDAGLFTLLDPFLKNLGQKKKDRKLSWKLVKQLGKKLDVDVPIPKSYQRGSK